MESETEHFPNWSPRRAVVIGYTSSLGSQVTERLLSAGWEVFGVSGKPASNPPASAGFEHIQINLASPSAFEQLFDLFKRTTPGLILHTATTYGDLKNTSSTLEDLELMFRINTFSFYLGFQKYCDLDCIEPFCSCIVINSDSIYHATGRTGPYASSKAALRILTSALSDTCRSANASVSTLLLGPLADASKCMQLRKLAEKQGVSEIALTREYLRRSNPFLVISELINLDDCYETIRHIVSLGKTANGMLCKLDGGSSGSLV